MAENVLRTIQGIPVSVQEDIALHIVEVSLFRDSENVVVAVEVKNKSLNIHFA